MALADGTILRLPQQNLAALVAVLRVLRGERLELPWGSVVVLSLSPAIPIFVHAIPTDMRKHFDGLAGIITVLPFGMDVLRGDYFVFLNRASNRCKILYWDRDGLVVWAKRLERGRFQLPSRGDATSLAIEVDAVTLAMMIGGIKSDGASVVSVTRWLPDKRFAVLRTRWRTGSSTDATIASVLGLFALDVLRRAAMINAPWMTRCWNNCVRAKRATKR